MKNLLYALGIAGSLILNSECRDNQKYKDFSNFMIKEGTEKSGIFEVYDFQKDNKRYDLFFSQQSDYIFLRVYDGKAMEYFGDSELNGLDYYGSSFDGRDIITDRFFQSKGNKQTFDSLIVNLPKWHAEAKK